ncbi:MAG: AEC family transporter, partial [Elusimicrobia bacterium]|nr:AEC family transporter [Elusimicrobiota bacterium]
MNLWLKIFIYILAGFILRSQKLLSEKIIGAFIDVALYFFIPVFILTAAWGSPVDVQITMNIGIVATGVLLAGTGFAAAFSWYRLKSAGSIKGSIKDSIKQNAVPGRAGYRETFRKTCLPVIFMNSAYLSIPINSYYFGSEGLLYAVIYNVVITFFNSTLGIWLIGGRGIGEIFRIPFLYASIAGLALNFANVPQPAFLITLNNFLKDTAMPAILLLVGYNINLNKALFLKDAAMAAGIRIFGGFLSGYLITTLLGLKGAAAGVAILASSMPSAINTYILSKKY